MHWPTYFLFKITFKVGETLSRNYQKFIGFLHWAKVTKMVVFQY